MARVKKRPAVSSHVQQAIFRGLSRAYAGFRVDPDRFLEAVRRAHGLEVTSFRDMFFVPQHVVDDLAARTISGTMKMAALQGAGLGMGGFATVVPDMGLLAVICMRMIQKLSLIYGFEYATEEETFALWIAAASAAGLDLGREFLEKEVVERFVPRVMERVAVRMGAEVAEKWTARIIPVVSGAIGAALNYYFIREWGRRAQEHFRERHMQMRRQVELGPPPPLSRTPQLTG